MRLDAELLGSGEFWAGVYGRALAWKLGAVAAMLATSVDSRAATPGPAPMW